MKDRTGQNEYTSNFLLPLPTLYTDMRMWAMHQSDDYMHRDAHYSEVPEILNNFNQINLIYVFNLNKIYYVFLYLFII